MNDNTKLKRGVVLLLLAVSSLCLQADKPLCRWISTLPATLADEAQCVCFDRQGMMWFGTLNGLKSYDGYQVRTYRNNGYHRNILGHNRVRCIIEGNNDCLWIGTNNGLTRYDKKRGTFETYFPEQKDQHIIYMLYQSHDGTIWAGTDGGLLRFDQTTHLFNRLDINSLDVRDHEGRRTQVGHYSPKCILEDKDGNMYIGTWADGLIRLSPDYKKAVCYRKTNAQNSAFDLHIDYKGRLWITTWGYGIERIDNPLDEGKSTIKAYPGEVEKWNAFSRIVEDTLTHTLWAVSYDGLSGIDLEDEDAVFLRYESIGGNNESQSLQMASHMAADALGNIWVSTTNEGVKHLSTRPSPFRSYPLPTKAKVNALFSFDGRHFWVGMTPSGLAEYDMLTGQTSYNALQTVDDRFCKTLITSICGTADGDVWIASAGYGIHVVGSNGENRHLSAAGTAFLQENYVTVLFRDSRDNMWVGQRSALGVAQLGRTTLDGADVRDICEDTQHRIWVATDNAGIYCFHTGARNLNGKKQYLPEQRNLPVLDVASIAVDGNGTIWAGSNSGGLLRHDASTDCFLPMSRELGIEDVSIYGLCCDREGCLWLSTEHGLFRVFKHKSEDGARYVLSAANAERISSGMNAMFRFGNTMFVGTEGSYFSYKPTEVGKHELDRQSCLLVTGLYIDNLPWEQLDSMLACGISAQTPAYTKRLVIPPSIGRFSIECSLLNYSNAANRYAYQLEGYDNGWTELEEGQRRMYFENLPPGNYDLHLKATDAFGNTTTLEEPIHIRILPPWYRTWWANLLYLFISVAFIWLAVYLYRQHLLTRNRLAMGRIFTQITHELLTPLTVISASVDEMRQDEAKYEDRYQVMQSVIDRLTRLLRQILEIRKSQEGQLRLEVSQGDITAFANRIVMQIRPMASVSGISLTLEGETVTGWFDMDKLDKILYNLLSNAVKYNHEGGKVEVRLQRNGSDLILVVADTGIGISKEKMKYLYSEFMDGDYRRTGTLGTGLGLSLTRDLVRLHHGTIHCQSVHGQGTTFTVTIPIDRKAYSDHEIAETALEAGRQHTLTPVVIDTEIQQSDQPVGDEPAALLIVEDNKELLSIMVNMLSKIYRVYKAPDGRVAWDIIQRHELDIVITDVMMPEVDGIELTRMIKESDDYGQLPVIMITAKTSDDDRNEGYRTGADEYIFKPFRTSDLCIRIENILRNRERIRRHFCRHTELQEAIKEQHLSSPEELFLRRASQFVIQHLDTADRESMAQALCMSSSSLYNKLRAATGQNVVGFITSIRMKEACRIMRRHPNMLISDVALRVGITTPHYFTKCFKEDLGMTPSEYLDRQKKQT